MNCVSTVDQAKSASYREKLDELISTGAIRGYGNTPPRKRAQPCSSRGKGQGVQWICENVDFNQKKCLFWPFSKDRGRAGHVGHLGKLYKATRLMCALANGAPPSAKHEVSYSCGRADKGCINPRHLAWKTFSENRRDQIQQGARRAFEGRQGKLTFAKAQEIRAIGHSRLLKDVAAQYGISPQRVSEILSGNGFTRQVKPWSFRNGRFYSRIVFKGCTYSLGSHETSADATAAYWTALERLRRGEPAIAPQRRKPDPSEIRRLYAPPAILKFGDRKGEAVISIAPDQEQSVLIMHNAFNKLHPKVRKFVLVASDTGDLTEAAIAAELSQEQVTAVLPQLRVYLQRHLQ
jgi:hypothetical protein